MGLGKQESRCTYSSYTTYATSQTEVKEDRMARNSRNVIWHAENRLAVGANGNWIRESEEVANK